MQPVAPLQRCGDDLFVRRVIQRRGRTPCDGASPGASSISGVRKRITGIFLVEVVMFTSQQTEIDLSASVFL
jgi:hypothetical protein